MGKCAGARFLVWEGEWQAAWREPEAPEWSLQDCRVGSATASLSSSSATLPMTALPGGLLALLEISWGLDTLLCPSSWCIRAQGWSLG